MNKKLSKIQFEYKEIDLNCIDINDIEYLITTKEDIDDLVESIGKIGLINFPIIIKKNTNQYKIISGFRRIKALKANLIDKISVRLIEPEVDRLEYIKLAISENINQRPLNIVEQARVIKLIFNNNQDINFISNIAQAFGLPYHPTFINQLLVISNLSKYIQECIINKIITLKIAIELSKLLEDEALWFSSFFDKFKICLNVQMQIILLIKEISKRESISISSILDDNYIKSK